MIEQIERYLPKPAGIRVYDSSGFSFIAGETRDLDFDSITHINGFSYNSVTGEATVTKPGRRLYRVSGVIRFGEQTNGSQRTTNLFVNGSQARRVDSHDHHTTVAVAYSRSWSEELYLTEGDVVKLRFTSGAVATTIAGTEQLTGFCISEA